MDLLFDRVFLIMVLLAMVNLLSTGFAALWIYSWINGSQMGHSAAVILTALAIIPLMWGGCLLFDVLWVAWWFVKRAWSLSNRLRHGAAA
ncbi:MAG: hypothetical protein ABSC13_02480 [Dehalococcoidia bacterium]|jgi:hypothetical protein